MILRQSTAVDVLIGPFVDATDGSTSETGETPSVKLSKNGQTLAAKNDITTPVHDADGYYNCELDATDTNTVGTLVLTVAASGTALPVRHEFQVVEEAAYDALYAASAAGPLQSTVAGRTLDVAATGEAGVDLANVNGTLDAADIGADAITAAKIAPGALAKGDQITGFNDLSAAQVNTEVDTALADIHLDHLFAVDYDPASKPGVATALLNELVEDDAGVSRYTVNALENGPSGSGASAASIADAVWDEATVGHTTSGTFGEQLKTDVDAILADTNELQGDWTDGGRLDLILDAVVADTNELQTDDVPGLIATLQADTDDIQTRLPAALIGGRMDSDVEAINNNTSAADNLAASAIGIVSTTVNDASATTTSFVTALTETTDDHYNGRIIVFTSGSLAGQATDITDYTGSTKTVTVTALTEAPANGVSFVIV